MSVHPQSHQPPHAERPVPSPMQAALRHLPLGARPPLKEGEFLCDHCSAKCCKYFAWPIETPVKREDFDYVRWAMLHAQTTFFVSENIWYVLVHTVCKHLQSDNRCGIYETRPQICRDYSTDECEFDDRYVYDQYFETPEQVEEYAEVVLSRRRKKGESIRSRKPALLPIMG